MKKAKRVVFVLWIISGAWLVFSYIPRILMWISIGKIFLESKFNSASSIGIIGGADGPTAIFVASGPVLPEWLHFVPFFALLAAWLILRFKTKE